MNKFKWTGKVSFPWGDKSAKDNTTTYESGKTKMTFTLFNKEQGFIDCETWSTTIMQSIKTDDMIEVTNYIVIKSNWVDKNTGAKRYRVSVNVQEIVNENELDWTGETPEKTAFNKATEKLKEVEEDNEVPWELDL